MKTVTFNNTVLRDGHQSLAATRMTTAQMLPAAPILDEMGFAGLETWGGATIDSCLRYLNENPFDRLRARPLTCPSLRADRPWKDRHRKTTSGRHLGHHIQRQ